VVGCTTGSRGEVPGERKLIIIRDDDNNNNVKFLLESEKL
jgi:hypothetical protein